MNKKNVLVVIDMQNDFITGILGTREAAAIVDDVAARIRLAPSYGENVYCTLDTHYYNYLETHEGVNLPVEHCLKGTGGWCLADKIHRALYETFGETVEKNAFGFLNWKTELPGDVETITLIGICTDICVLSNALILRAMYPEAEIIVREDLCAGTTPENHKAAIAMMKQNHITIHTTHKQEKMED